MLHTSVHFWQSEIILLHLYWWLYSLTKKYVHSARACVRLPSPHVIKNWFHSLLSPETYFTKAPISFCFGFVRIKIVPRREIYHSWGSSRAHYETYSNVMDVLSVLTVVYHFQCRLLVWGYSADCTSSYAARHKAQTIFFKWYNMKRFTWYSGLHSAVKSIYLLPRRSDLINWKRWQDELFVSSKTSTMYGWTALFLWSVQKLMTLTRWYHFQFSFFWNSANSEIVVYLFFASQLMYNQCSQQVSRFLEEKQMHTRSELKRLLKSWEWSSRFEFFFYNGWYTCKLAKAVIIVQKTIVR